jgi:hypothetical protein
VLGTQMMEAVSSSEAVPWLRHLSPQRPRFTPKSVNVGFVVDKVALGQVFTDFFCFLLSIAFHHISPLSHIYIYIYISPGGRTIGLLVATVQRHSLTPST